MEKLTLKWIEPEALQSVWQVIRPGLDKVAAMHDQWIPEDIYLAIKNGTVNLHVGYQGESYSGFLIIQQQLNFYGKCLHVWATYSNDKKEACLLQQGMEDLEQWAKQIGAKRITFSSPRKGWERNNIGFKPTMIHYEKQL